MNDQTKTPTEDQRKTLLTAIHQGIYVSYPLSVIGAVGHTQEGYNNLLNSIADSLIAYGIFRENQSTTTERKALLERTEGSALDHFLNSFNGDEAGDIDYVWAEDGNTGWAMRGGNDVETVLLKAFEAVLASDLFKHKQVEAEKRGAEAMRERILRFADKDGLIDQNLVASIEISGGAQ